MAHIGETLTLLFRKRENGTFEVEVKESWSGRSVTGSFAPPYTNKQLNVLHKKLNTLERNNSELRTIGQRLFSALCGSPTPSPSSGTARLESSEQSVQALLRNIIQRILRRRGTVALILCFTPGCDEFVRYPWELLHNGEHFLLASGIFTLTRTLLRPDAPGGSALPVHPPMRILYIGASPSDHTTLETERSFEALARGLSRLVDSGQIHLDRLEPPTFDELVRYLNMYGGVGVLDDSETSMPCYALHFDGHGAYGRLCPSSQCDTLHEANARTCSNCGTSLSRVKAQTYLCFCNEVGCNQFIDTQSLRDLLLSSDIRLAVFSACETATVAQESAGNRHQSQQAAVDATLATALVMAQVPAVVAMPFSLQDDLSPTFMFHLYEALADGRTLEEALSRARQALLPKQQKSWFIPVLYRHVAEGQQGPVAFLDNDEKPAEADSPFAHLPVTTTFVGRGHELRELRALLTAARGEQMGDETLVGAVREYPPLRHGIHHITLSGPAGIGKSALAFEAARRSREQFPGGIIALSLQGGKSLGEALIEMAHALLKLRSTPGEHTSKGGGHPSGPLHPTDLNARERQVLTIFRSLASRELPCLLLLDSFEEVKTVEVSAWLRFLCALPAQVVVLTTSRSHPAAVATPEATLCRWYEYSVGKMDDADLLKLFTELAADSGLDQRIHLENEEQQAVLRQICTLLDGYPLGAELIFGTARLIEGKLYPPEAATRSLEEIRDELQDTHLAGIWAVLELAYLRLSPPARLLLSYLSAFKLPFSREQILLLVAPETGAIHQAPPSIALEREHQAHPILANSGSRPAGAGIPAELAQLWRAARDELVQASCMQFDGRVYAIHPQVRQFALAYLPIEERRRVHRVGAAYYSSLSQPTPEEWFAAFEHLESAGEPSDLTDAVRLAVQASWALRGRGRAIELLAMLHRAQEHALRQHDITGEGQIQCCIGAILRILGSYPEALGCLTHSLALHQQQQERDEAGWALYELALLFREQGHFQQAGTYAREALDLFHEAGDANGEAWMQMVLGEVSRGYGRYSEALKYFDLALKHFRILHSTEGEASTLRDRGTVYQALGRFSEALLDYEEALRLFNTLVRRPGQAWVLTNRAEMHIDQGQLDLAEQRCSEGLVIFREQRMRRGEGWALQVMGDIARERANLADARSYYEQALALFKGVGDRVGAARVLNALGALAWNEGIYPVAQDCYEQAQAMSNEQGARPIEGRALRGLGDVARLLRRFPLAKDYYAAALTIALELDTPAERCAVLRRQGLLCHLQQHYTETLECWVQALAFDHRLEHPARISLQSDIDKLVAEQQLEEAYAAYCQQYGI